MVENVIQRAVKARLAGRHEAKRLFPTVDFDAVNLGSDLQRIWLETMPWVAACLSRASTKSNTGSPSACEVYYRKKPPLRVIHHSCSPGRCKPKPTNSRLRSAISTLDTTVRLL